MSEKLSSCRLVVCCFDGSSLGLLLCNTLGNKSIEFGLLLLLRIEFPALESIEVTAALETDGGNETLNFGCLSVWFGILLLRALNLSPDNILPDIIILAQVEEFANLSRTLGTEAFRQNVVGKTWDFAFALLDDNEREDSNIGADNATTHGLALTLTGTADAVARVALGKQETNTVGKENTLLHREPLLVIAASDTEDVALPFIAERVGRDLLRDLLVVEDTDALLVIEIEELLVPRSGVGDIELHT